ncbi:MAG: hypothetical protein U0894_14720 [Pirellulales bacterium]
MEQANSNPRAQYMRSGSPFMGRRIVITQEKQDKAVFAAFFASQVPEK